MEFSSPEIEELGRFVRARRMATTASDSGEILRRRRHVPYITQSDLAELVGVSTVVVSQIEQARYPNLNSAILRRISRVLDFSRQQELYALGLLASRPTIQRGREDAPAWIVESVADTRHPVFVVNPAYDLMATNRMADSMLGEYASAFYATGNALISVFQVPEMRRFFVDWDEYARSIVSGLRMSYGVHPEYRDYISDLANTMANQDDYFRERWNEADPLVVATIEKDLAHPSLGRLQMIQVVTIAVQAPDLTLVEFLPADEKTREKLTSVQG